VVLASCQNLAKKEALVAEVLLETVLEVAEVLDKQL
jgi:hypothetical protein